MFFINFSDIISLTYTIQPGRTVNNYFIYRPITPSCIPSGTQWFFSFRKLPDNSQTWFCILVWLLFYLWLLYTIILQKQTEFSQLAPRCNYTYGIPNEMSSAWNIIHPLVKLKTISWFSIETSSIYGVKTQSITTFKFDVWWKEKSHICAFLLCSSFH